MLLFSFLEWGYCIIEVFLISRVGLLDIEVSSFQGVGVPLYTEVSSFQGVGIEELHCIQGVLILGGWSRGVSLLYIHFMIR